MYLYKKNRILCLYVQKELTQHQIASNKAALQPITRYKQLNNYLPLFNNSPRDYNSPRLNPVLSRK